MFEWLASLSEGESVAVGLFAVLGAIWATIHQLTLDRIGKLERRTRELEAALKVARPATGRIGATSGHVE